MDSPPIRNDEDHARALARIADLWGSPEGSPEAEALAVLVTQVVAYEATHHAIAPPGPGQGRRLRDIARDAADTRPTDRRETVDRGLARFAGSIPRDDLRTIGDEIASGCEQVPSDPW